MKATIVFLVLAAFGGLMYCNAEGLAGTQETEDKELRALLESHRDTLKSMVDYVRARIDGEVQLGPEIIGRLTEVEHDLLNAELELARSREDRIAILEKALKQQIRWETVVEKRQEDGFTIGSIKADRIAIEIAFHKARKGP